MKKQKFEETKVIRSLTRKGLNVDYANHLISFTKHANEVGLSTLAKLDYLEKYCGWRVLYNRVTEIDARDNDDKSEVRNNKKEKINKINNKQLRKMLK
jgi:hypothetical protein